MSKLELEIGGVYQAEDKGQGIFIGYVNTTLLEVVQNEDDERNKFSFKQEPIENAMLFYEIFKFETIEKSLKDISSTKDMTLQYKILSSHPYIQKVKMVELPQGIIEKLRSKTSKSIKDSILEFTGHTDKDFYQRIDADDLCEQISFYSQFINLYSIGGPPVTPFDVRKLLLFS
jgi:hypothetical protein